MPTIIKRQWTSRGPTGHRVKRVAYGYSLVVGGKQERRYDMAWSRQDAQEALAALRHLLRLAHEEWEVIDRAPRVRLEREPQGRIRWLESDEEARLLAACARSQNKDLAAIVTVAIESGMRHGEIMALTWERVD